MGLLSAYLLEAQSPLMPHAVFAEWDPTERGALRLPAEAAGARSVRSEELEVQVEVSPAAAAARLSVSPEEWSRMKASAEL